VVIWLTWIIDITNGSKAFWFGNLFVSEKLGEFSIIYFLVVNETSIYTFGFLLLVSFYWYVTI